MVTPASSAPNQVASEEVVWSGKANLVDGAIALGGQLTLTRDALVFKAHRLNLKTGKHTTLLSAVREISFSGINRTTLALEGGEKVTYVVFRRKPLAGKIRAITGLGHV